jgi:hypothetical protein
MHQTQTASSPLPRPVVLRPVVLRPVQRVSPDSNSKLVDSPAIVRGNQELRELALQISKQVLPNRSPGLPVADRMAPSRDGRKWPLAVTLVGSTAAGLLLAVALWTGPALIRTTDAQLAAGRSPAMATQAKSALAANPVLQPVHALSALPARGDIEAFGELRIKQPQWSVSAAAAKVPATGNDPTASSNPTAANTLVAEPQPKPEAPVDTTASIAPRQLRDPDSRHAAQPTAAAHTHVRPVADPVHRTRRGKRPAPAPPEAAPALSAGSAVEPADQPIAPSTPDVAGRTGFKR